VSAESVVNGKGVDRLPTESIESMSEGALILLPEAANKRTKLQLSSSLRRPLEISIMIILDALALLLGLALAGYLLGGESRAVEVLRFAPILMAVLLSVFAAWDLYVRAQKRNHMRVLGAVFSGMGLLSIGSIMYPQGGFSFNEILLGTLFIMLSVVELQFLYERGSGFIHRHGWGLIPTLLIGEAKERASVREAMKKNPGAYTCVGELNTSVGAIDLPLVRKVLDRTGAQSVILATGTERLPRNQFRDVLHSMRLRNVRVKLVCGESDLTGGDSPVLQEQIGVRVLDIGSPRLDTTQWALKRMLDVAGSLGGLLVLSPMLIMVAILIRLTSPGPALFRQKRVGSDEKVFTCYKFRSMYEDADRRQAELEARNEAGDVIFKIQNDPRVTPIGRFIRRSSIDELPQLINVLKGEMSLVGPRPLPLRDFERMNEVQKKRLGIAPGITGFWQVSGRSDVTFEEMLRLDLRYIEKWSLALDIRILFKTLKVVLRRDGAC
jgi:exopolysaccharide biosynthesis polyprenyl glycosylphosphotransferase